MLTALIALGAAALLAAYTAGFGARGALDADRLIQAQADRDLANLDAIQAEVRADRAEAELAACKDLYATPVALRSVRS